MPAGIARQQQHHHISEGNQQDQPHHRHQDGQWFACVGARETSRRIKAEYRRLLLASGCQSQHRRRRETYLASAQPPARGSPLAPIVPACAGTTTSASAHRACRLRRRVAPGVQLRAILQRDPEICQVPRLHPFKACRSHTHHRDRYTFHIKRLPQDVWIAGEADRPVVVANHGDGRTISPRLAQIKSASRHLHAEPGERIAAPMSASVPPVACLCVRLPCR